MKSRYLDRAEAAQHLTKRGLHVSKNTLQKWATVGGGPQYRRFGNRAVYQESDLDAWAEQKLTAPRCTYDRKTGETPKLDTWAENGNAPCLAGERGE